MSSLRRCAGFFSSIFIALGVGLPFACADDTGFVSLFNGKDLSGWLVPEGDGGHWKVVDGVIDYDAETEAKGDKHLWTDKQYGDFVFRCEWRITSTPYLNPRVPIIQADGTHKLDADGKPITITVPDSDSGILLRGDMKSQINIWCWPCGSGEVYGYRMDPTMPAATRADVVPRVNADKNIGQWNKFEITVRGSRVSVVLNGRQVLQYAELPGLPARGPIGLQHHGSKNAQGEWTSPPSLVQFRNIEIQELAPLAPKKK
ncbi:MAG: DUF1080 domain-containing protein [Planctomycetia bacterium]|nr:DUF1080 domain-containing protein [Planctomycetia bacterium]